MRLAVHNRLCPTELSHRQSSNNFVPMNEMTELRRLLEEDDDVYDNNVG